MSGTSATPRAIVFGCAGETLGPAERDFFAACDPLGFILFKRNVRHPTQVADLVREFRGAVGRRDAPVLIDQEGGRVQRLGPPHWPRLPAQRQIGVCADRDGLPAGEALARAMGRLIGADLIALGIDVDCYPVADVPVAGSHDIIGDRAYASAADRVARLARAAAEGLMEAGVAAIAKHIPGHGRARVDSHVSLPVVEATLAELRRSDFVPFKALADLPWAMTAHVLYTALDPKRPATMSPTIIGDIIRGEIGFRGALISDDLSMGALGGSLAERAEEALAAGCDVVLHCNGDMAEMEAIARVVPRLSGGALARVRRAGTGREQRLSATTLADARARAGGLLALA